MHMYMAMGASLRSAARAHDLAQLVIVGVLAMPVAASAAGHPGLPLLLHLGALPHRLGLPATERGLRRQELPAVADPADLGGRDRMPPTSPPRLVRGLCHVRRHDPCGWTPDRGSAKPIACPEPRTSTRSASRDTGAATPVKPCIRRLRAPKPRSAPIIHRDGWGLAAQMTGRLCGQD